MLETLQHTQTWNQYFAPLHSLNFSIYMDETQNTLWRVQNGVLDSVKPKVSLPVFTRTIFCVQFDEVTALITLHLFWQIIVLHVGTNNVKNTAEEIADGISEIVKSIREKLPEVYIVLPVSCMQMGRMIHQFTMRRSQSQYIHICFLFLLCVRRRHYYLVDICRIRYVRKIIKSINWLLRNIRRSVRIKCKPLKSIKA